MDREHPNPSADDATEDADDLDETAASPEDAAGTGEGEDEDERRYTKAELEREIQKAKAAVQSAKDREKAQLEARIATMEAELEALRSAPKVPEFESAEQEAQYWRQKAMLAQAQQATERLIAAEIARVNAEFGTAIKRDDPRLREFLVPHPNAEVGKKVFLAGLKAIAREDAAKGTTKGAGQRGQSDQDDEDRRAERRYDGGSGGPTTGYDPKRYRNTGDVAGSLRAKRQAGLR